MSRTRGQRSSATRGLHSQSSTAVTQCLLIVANYSDLRTMRAWVKLACSGTNSACNVIITLYCAVLILYNQCCWVTKGLPSSQRLWRRCLWCRTYVSRVPGDSSALAAPRCHANSRSSIVSDMQNKPYRVSTDCMPDCFNSSRIYQTEPVHC